MHLLQLPNELLRFIAEYLSTDADLNALIQTHSRFYHLLETYLFEHNARYGKSSALLWAAAFGHIEVAKRSLRAQGRANAIVPLHKSLLTCPNPHMLSDYVFLENGVYCSTPIMFAAVCGHKEMAELLVSHGADMGRWTGHSTPLLEAIDHGHTEVAEYFLMNSADFDINRQFYIYCPIEHAAHDGYVDIVKLLLRYGVDPNGFPALIAATARGHVEVSRVLLEAGASIEKIYPEGGKNQDAFFSAAGFNRPAAVALLIEYGASLERRDVRGRTPLIFAAQCQSLEAVEVLLRHGAKANALVHGCTALSFAIDEGSVPMTKLLLENGADVAITHDQPSDNVSFLLRVMNRRHDPEVIAAMMKLLLNHGADPNDCDRKGRTPLFFATMRHDLEMMRLLLAHGANPNRDDEKIDLLSWAFLKGHEDIVQTLLAYGAR